MSPPNGTPRPQLTCTAGTLVREPTSVQGGCESVQRTRARPLFTTTRRGRMGWLRRYGLKLFLLSCSSALAAGVFVASVMAGDQEDEDHESILRVGAVLAVAVVLVTASETALNEREKERARKEAGRAAAALALTYHSTLAPLSEALATLSQEYAAAYAGTGVAPPAGLASTQAAQSAVIRKTVRSAPPSSPPSRTPPPTSRGPGVRSTASPTAPSTSSRWRTGPAPRPTTPDHRRGGRQPFLHDILERGAPGSDVRQGDPPREQGPTSSVRHTRSVIAVPVVAGGPGIRCSRRRRAR